MTATTEVQHDVSPSTPSRGNTFPSRKTTLSTNSKDAHSQSSASEVSPLPSEQPMSPCSPNGSTLYNYFHIRDKSSAPAHTPTTNMSARTPSVDPSIVAVQGSAINVDLYNAAMRGAKRTWSKGPLSPAVSEEVIAESPGSPLDIQSDGFQDIEQVVTLPGTDGVLHNDRVIAIDFDSVSALPDANTISAALMAIHTIGHPIHLVANDKDAALWWLEEGGIKVGDGDRDVVAAIWQVQNMADDQTKGFVEEQASIANILASNNVAALLTADASTIPKVPLGMPTIRIVPDAKRSAAVANKEGEQALITVPNWKGAIAWIVKWDKQTANPL